MESLVSDIPAGDGKIANLFLQYNCHFSRIIRYRESVFLRIISVRSFPFRAWPKWSCEHYLKGKIQLIQFIITKWNEVPSMVWIIVAWQLFQRHEIIRGAPDEPVREICRFKNGGSLRRKENSGEGDQQVLSCLEEGKTREVKEAHAALPLCLLDSKERCYST